MLLCNVDIDTFTLVKEHDLGNGNTKKACYFLVVNDNIKRSKYKQQKEINKQNVAYPIQMVLS